MTPLRELAKSLRVVAIGETGLDYHRLPSVELAKDRKTQVFAKALQTSTDEQMEAEIHDGAYKSKQASLFEQQLDLAVELGFTSFDFIAQAHPSLCRSKQIIPHG